MAGYQRLHRPAADVKASTIAALQAGKGQLHAPDYATADYSGWCEAAVVVDQMGYGHMRLQADGQYAWESKRTLSMKVRCRKCEGCRKERRMMWTARAAREWRQSTRTWFVTLTLRPEDHYKLQTQVRVDVAAEGGNIDAMEPRDRLERFLVAYRHRMDLFLMRLRTGLRQQGWSQLRFRYLWVPEPHKSGAIHFHMLLHEVSDEMPIRKERIEAAWPHGFIKAKLVKSEEAARYVTKYLGKHHFEGRIRASTRYGKIEGDPEEMLARPAFPGHVQGAPRNPYGSEDPKARSAELRAELGFVPGEEEAEELTEGEELGACATGLHFGVPCNCKIAATDSEDDPWGTQRGDVLTPQGVPRRKWQLRGWHEPNPGKGAPGVPRGPKRKRETDTEEIVH